MSAFLLPHPCVLQPLSTPLFIICIPTLLLSFLPALSLPPLRKQVDTSRKEADADGVQVPTTLQEYCQQHKPHQSTSSFDMADDLFDDEGDYYQDSSEEEEDMDSASGGSDVEQDSGTA